MKGWLYTAEAPNSQQTTFKLTAHQPHVISTENLLWQMTDKTSVSFKYANQHHSYCKQIKTL
jgi:hypothetical protein